MTLKEEAEKIANGEGFCCRCAPQDAVKGIHWFTCALVTGDQAKALSAVLKGMRLVVERHAVALNRDIGSKSPDMFADGYNQALQDWSTRLRAQIRELGEEEKR